MSQELTQFKKGHKTWNKGVKKATNTGKTHFKKGSTAWNKGKKGVMPTPHNKGIDTRVMAECLICMKRFKFYPKASAGKYCSPACNGIAQSGANNHNWTGGGWLTVRKMVLAEQDYTCQVCGLREIEIMEVNHKLERSQYPELARDKNNLEVLCPNCHRRKTNQFLKSKVERNIIELIEE